MNESTVTDSGLYLNFRLGQEVFAIDVFQVREVLDLSSITRVPGAPDFMRGVINVRGSVVPVVDLKLKFGLPQTSATVDTRIVVMEVTLDGETIVIGALADAVHEVLELDPHQIEEAPRIGIKWDTESIKGIGKRDDQFIIIVDINKVFSMDEITFQKDRGKSESVPDRQTLAA